MGRAEDEAEAAADTPAKRLAELFAAWEREGEVASGAGWIGQLGPPLRGSFTQRGTRDRPGAHTEQLRVIHRTADD
jgi:hypothetical protein